MICDSDLFPSLFSLSFVHLFPDISFFFSLSASHSRLVLRRVLALHLKLFALKVKNPALKPEQSFFLLYLSISAVLLCLKMLSKKEKSAQRSQTCSHFSCLSRHDLRRMNRDLFYISLLALNSQCDVEKRTQSFKQCCYFFTWERFFSDH